MNTLLSAIFKDMFLQKQNEQKVD